MKNNKNKTKMDHCLFLGVLLYSVTVCGHPVKTTSTTTDSARHPTTTTTTTTPIQLGCTFKGKFFVVGEEMERGFDERSNWCYGAHCGDDGQVVYWDNFNCKPTTTPGTTEIPSTTPSPTEILTSSSTAQTEDSTLTPDKPTGSSTTTPDITTTDSTTFGCFFHLTTTKEPTTTTEEPTTTQPLLRGCMVNGQVYQPGQSISEGYDESSNWCYGTYCSYDSEVIPWDNFKCKTTTALPTTVPTKADTITELLTEQTTIPPFPADGCMANGKYYAPGESIDSGSDGNWCYGRYCDENGDGIKSWGRF